MRIHKDIKLILLGYPEDFNCEVNPLLIVDSGPGMLNGFPGKNVPDGVVTPLPQPFEMDMGVLQWEGPSDKRDVVSIKELIRNVGGGVGCLGIFRIARDVDSSKRNFSVVRVSEGLTLDPKT